MGEDQHPKASGNGLSTLHKKGRAPPDVSLDSIADDLMSYFKEFPVVKEYEKEIEKKYDIKKEHDGCWPVDDIKRAWGKTKRMYETSRRRKCWSLAVMLQMMKRHARDDESKAQSDPRKESAVRARGESQNKRREPPADVETIYIHVPFSEMFGHKSSFSSDPVPMESLPYKLKDKVPSFTEIKKKTSYVMLYDKRTRNAAWVYEILNKSIVDENKRNKNIKRPSSYKVDGSIHELFQTPEGSDPYPKPFDRGHLAPACNHRSSQRAQDDTFVLSNISPQHKSCNRGIWRKLENRCVQTAKKEKVRNVHVYTGPLYPSDNNDLERVEYQFVGGKVLPTHFFKVIIEEEEDGNVLEPKCYKIPNEELQNNDELAKFEVDIEDIERESGLIFTDRRREEGTIDRMLTVNRHTNPDPQNCRSITVSISTALSDPVGI